MEREALSRPRGLALSPNAGPCGWRVGRRSGPTAKFGEGTELRASVAGRAAAVASPWVAGSVGDRLVSYVQRWAWARGVRKALDSIVT